MACRPVNFNLRKWTLLAFMLIDSFITGYMIYNGAFQQNALDQFDIFPPELAKTLKVITVITVIYYRLPSLISNLAIVGKCHEFNQRQHWYGHLPSLLLHLRSSRSQSVHLRHLPGLEYLGHRFGSLLV